jgi:hypothetical protein
LYIDGLDPIKDKTESITFKDFVEDILGAPFEEVYKDYILEDTKDYE